MTEQPDQSWRQWAMEATGAAGTAGFTPGPANPQPLNFAGAHIAPPHDPLAGLPDAAAMKMVALEQRAADLFATVPSHEQISEVRLEVTGYKNRIADLERHRSDGGFGLDASAPQVQSERRKLERAEKELARLVELKEVRSSRWSSAAQLHQAASDWAMRGVPGDCVCDVVPDVPVAELLKKNESLSDGVARYRLLQRQAAAERHRVNSQQWPVSMAETAARELIERRAETGRPVLENAIEHNLPISFATTRLTSRVYNVDAPGAIAYAEAEDSIGLLCWLFGPEILKKISAGFREIGDGEHALDERQRAEILATIDVDDEAAQRAECSIIWAAAERGGEVIDFRPTTSPQAVLGVALRTVPRATEMPGTTPGHTWDVLQPGGRR